MHNPTRYHVNLGIEVPLWDVRRSKVHFSVGWVCTSTGKVVLLRYLFFSRVMVYYMFRCDVMSPTWGSSLLNVNRAVEGIRLDLGVAVRLC